MPEGPEMRRAADRIARVVAGRTIEQVWFAFDHLTPHEAALTGQRVRDVATRGKALLIHFDNDWSIYTHNQLYGRWYVQGVGQRPKTGRQLRLLLETDRKAALLYSASDIEVWPTERLHEQRFISRVGPDLLSDGVGVEQVLERLRDRRFRNRQLAGLLLDQSFLAGIGNYLRADMLFEARIHPSARTSDLAEGSQEILAEAIVNIIRRAYRTAGVTNDPERVERLKAKGIRRNAFRHLVYDRAGEPCYECGRPVDCVALGGRKIYYCDTCQDEGRRRPSSRRRR
ncbi:MAG: endonuclease VIII [Pseudomonadota bacterium]